MDKKRKKSLGSRISGPGPKIQIEHDLPILERIKYPIIWERITTGYRIQDLQPSRIDSAIEIIKNYYIHEDPLCKGVNLASDPPSVEEFVNLVTVWMKDTLSLAAVEDGTGKFVGLLIARVLDKTVRTQSRMLLYDSDAGSTDLDNKVFGEDDYDVICPPLPCTDVFREEKTASPLQRNIKAKMNREEKKFKFPEKKKKSKEFKKSDFKLLKQRSASERSGKSIDLNAALIDFKNQFEPKLHIKWRQPMFDDEFVVYESPLLMKIHRFRSFMIRRVDILNIFEVDNYYSIHLLYVIPQHRGKGIGNALIRSAVDLCKKLGCDILTAIFTNTSQQNTAYGEGFRAMDEINLSDWMEDDQPVFQGIDEFNNTTAIMVYKMEEPLAPMPHQSITPPRRRTKMPPH